MGSRRPEARNPRHATIAVTGLFLVGLLSGAWVGSAAVARAQDPYASLELFAKVLGTIRANYVDPIDTDTLVNAAIRGMVEELDPHSRWLSAEAYTSFQDDTHGSYEGIGVELQMATDGVLVNRVLDGGPAQRDGVLTGDHIVAVDGTALEGLSLDQVATHLRGTRGVSVTLTISRDGQDAPLEIETIRDRVVTPAASGTLGPDVIGYVRLHQFQDDAADSIVREVRRLTDEAGSPLRGLVLDLRDNPGGLLDQAVAVTDLFLDEGLIVSTRGRLEGASEHYATPGGISTELPLAILVNGMSASASEIVTGALQDTHRATIVGVPTYGKGSVQVVYENRDHSALKLTIARYYTPSGDAVATTGGRIPDIRVEPPSPPDDPARRLRAKLEASPLPQGERQELLALLDELPISPPNPLLLPTEGDLRERLEQDPQLRRAFEVVRDASSH